ncbi:MAG: S8 family peptidase [Ignavibacteriales bacterium]|nr:S8 family peptidase [Ignavibacteriales bacterium]
MKRMVLHVLAMIILLLVGFNNPLRSQSSNKYWVYFTDKGAALPTNRALARNSSAYQIALRDVNPRALARRAKVLPQDALLDVDDLPVYEPYLVHVQKVGGTLVHRSRWLNAVSFRLTPDQVAVVSKFLFVKSVKPVMVFRGRTEGGHVDEQHSSLQKVTSFDYGQSATQVQVINIAQLHDAGITGHDVLVGMLDTGFRWREHEALQTRHVIAEHDFIFNDETTANQVGDASGQDFHGTLTMSVVGGYQPGKLIGPAFNADFILGKTEYVPSETRIEEDNWAAAIEWMEGYGVDVASSSLGYNTFDPPDSGYTWAHGDFDGKTSVTAKAAARAARLGVVVCDAMGNEGNGDGIIGTMLTPADADSIVSVGAVNFSKQLASFSSTGPTNDNRTKPDVVAPGVSVYGAFTPGPNTYGAVSGTSLATPLTAGSAALLLSARPELTPIQARDALRNTAEPITNDPRFPASPNNFTGWGLVNAFQAALSFGPIFSNRPTVSSSFFTTVVSIDVISNFGIDPDSVILWYATGSESSFSSIQMTFDSTMFYPTSGRYKTTIPPFSIGTLVRFYVTARDSGYHSYRSPAPITDKVWQLNYGITGIGESPLLPTGFTLRQNYPNPFNPRTVITYDLPHRDHVTLSIYNVLGEIVSILVNEMQDAGSYAIGWDGSNLPSGVYIYRLSTLSFVASHKMVLIR